MHSRNILRAGTKIGTFKFDVGTVYVAPGTNSLSLFHKIFFYIKLFKHYWASCSKLKTPLLM